MIKMIKRVIIPIILLISIICMITSCNTCDNTDNNNSGRMVFVEKIDNTMAHIYYDRYTKVMYIISQGSENNGNATVMVDANGNPLLYDGD